MSRKIGCDWEKQAGIYLQNQGYIILEYNYNTKYGEIDIIALDKHIDASADELVFVEVKFRSDLDYGRAFEFVNNVKLSKLKKAIMIYLDEHDEFKYDYRIDVLSFEEVGENLQINHFVNITF